MSTSLSARRGRRATKNPVASLKRLVRDIVRPRVLLVAATHAMLFAVGFWISFCLRFDFVVPTDSFRVFCISLPWILGIKLAIFYLSGQFHGWWKHVTFADLTALLRASLVALIFIAAIDHFLFPFQVPRSVLILDSIIGILLLGSLRASWRLFREGLRPIIGRDSRRPAIIVGVTDSSGILAHQVNSHSELSYRICGFVDRDGSQAGAHLGQIPVVGGEQDLVEIAEDHGVSEILVSAETLTGNRLRQLVSRCEGAGLNLKVIPPPEERFKGGDRIPIREIQINDVLRREPVNLDTRAIEELVRNRSVMVTGAGGSIGSEICRQLLNFGPESLILVDQAENNVFSIDRELRQVAEVCGTRVFPCVADVTDPNRLRPIFSRLRPGLVFHAAAHKHVPLMELNAGEAIQNNVLGTKCVADLADEFEVQTFVLISTDKAVNPTSVMGVTKQLAERYTHSLSQVSESTEYVVVRFGNVLGSVGSVVPIFQEQIRNGGPITITDERMRRFFMTIPEASQLVLQAAAMGNGGEIFVLDMGEPVRIIDLAWDLIRLSGLPRNAIDISVVGIRPGEKLYEELYFNDENTLPTKHPKVRAAYHRHYPFAEVLEMVDELQTLIDRPDEEVRARLSYFVPEYEPLDDSNREMQEAGLE